MLWRILHMSRVYQFISKLNLTMGFILSVSEVVAEGNRGHHKSTQKFPCFLAQIDTPNFKQGFNRLSNRLNQLVTRLEKFWDPREGKFEVTDLSEDEFIEILDQYNKNIDVLHNPEVHFGFIEKKVVKQGSQIFVRADLHGDLKS